MAENVIDAAIRITDMRREGAARVLKALAEVDMPGRVESHVNPYLMVSEQALAQGESCARQDELDAGSGATKQPQEKLLYFVRNDAIVSKVKVPPRNKSVIRLPSYEQVKSDPVLYAHANRVLHLETNPGNARALVQAHGE